MNGSASLQRRTKRKTANFGGNGDKVDPVFRFIRLRAEAESSQHSPYKILSSFEGIRVKVNGKLFDV